MVPTRRPTGRQSPLATTEGIDVKNERDRREVLRLLAAAGCAAVAGLPHLTGCSSDAGEEPATVALERAEVESAGRVVVRWQDQPVEVRRTEKGFEALSLVCTHIGCTVRWEPERNRYACPCHEGLFDAQGAPISGPPTEPLRAVPVSATESHVTIGA
jgi:cytochrome b6-f complex iron-sulfur subunit